MTDISPVNESSPDVRVTTLAYLDTVLPPKSLRPRDNVLRYLEQVERIARSSN